MSKLWTLGIFWLLIITLSCQKKDNRSEEASGSLDTLAVKQENAQVIENDIKLLDLTYSQRKGKLLYEKYCTVCHGTEGKGDGFNAYNLDPKPKDITKAGYLQVLSDSWLVEAISQGGRGVNRSILMPSWENTLSKEQIENIVTYLRLLSR